MTGTDGAPAVLVAVVGCYTSRLVGGATELAAWDAAIAAEVMDRMADLPWYYEWPVQMLLRGLEFGVIPFAGGRFSRLPVPARQRWFNRFERRVPGAAATSRMLGMMATQAFFDRARRVKLP